MFTTEVEASSELVHCVAGDGREYIVRPTEWTIDLIEEYWEKFSRYEIFSDDFPQGLAGFQHMVVQGGGLWFDIVDVERDEAIGVMYITELIPSATDNIYISAGWHSAVWDAKAAPRLVVARAAIKAIMQRLQIHRLEVKIPLKFGGAIRLCKRIGFVEEGRLRKARRLGGEWWDVLQMSVLDSEVETWEV